MRPIIAFVILLLAPFLHGQQEDLAALSQRGKELMSGGRFGEAAGVYEKLNKAVPNNPGLLMNLGMARHMGGESAKAIPHFEAALRLQPGIVPALLFLGASHLELGHPGKAVGPLEEVVAAQPNMVQARQLLGDAMVGVERLEEATEHYRRWSQLDNSSPKVWYSLGTTYESLALKAFGELERSAPESPYMLALVGEVRESQKQYRSAFYLYRTALEREPNLKGVHTAIGRVYRATGHPDWAELEDGLERQLPAPDCAGHPLECGFNDGKLLSIIESGKAKPSPEELYWRSRAYNQLAKEAFARLSELPPSLESYEMVAQMHRTQGRHVEAVKAWHEALKLAPGDPTLETELAVSMHQSRDYDGAKLILERLVQTNPTSAQINFYLGDSYLLLQKPAEAVAPLQAAVKYAPDFLPARSSLGRAYLQLNRGAEAIPQLEAALPLDKDGSTHFQLARAYQASGDHETAKKMMAAYQKIRRTTEAEMRELEEAAAIVAP